MPKHPNHRRRWVWALVAIVVVAPSAWLVAGYALDAMVGSLVHRGSIEPSQAILIENLDPDYLLFERAGEMLRQGWGDRVLIQSNSVGWGNGSGSISVAVIEVMARQARIPEFETIPVRHREPITLNTALQVRDYLSGEDIRSVIVVSPGFRSRRSYLVWSSVLEPVGIRIALVPVFGRTTPDNWRETWHGRQEVLLQFLKLAYYRVRVL